MTSPAHRNSGRLSSDGQIRLLTYGCGNRDGITKRGEQHGNKKAQSINHDTHSLAEKP